jgi:hypothetical protein
VTRDYKARRAAPLDSRRLRDFGAGALAGIAITALACIALNVALQRESARAAPPGQHPGPGEAQRKAATAPEAPTFDKILADPEQQMPRQQQVLERGARTPRP